MKKKYKVLLIVIIVLVLVAAGLAGYFFFFYEKPTEETPVNDVQIKNTIDTYGYNLDDRDSAIFEEKFNELKDLLNVEGYDVQEYVSLVSQLFIIDLYTINNKISRYDVGGLEYVYPDAVTSFQTVAENSIYRTVENNLDGTRTQELPEVSSITVASIKTTTFTMPDETVVDGYGVQISWEYVEDLGYDDAATLILIPSGEKYGVVYLEPR